MKQLTAILSCLLLVWMPFASAPAAQACAKPTMACGGTNCHMACCAARNSAGAKSAPAVPAQKIGASNQISLPATAAVWKLPDNSANRNCFVAAANFTAGRTALYTRDCALLI